MRLLRRKDVGVATADRYFRLGADHASRLGQAHIGSEHVLLALASIPDGEAAAALARLGVTPHQIEAEILRNPSQPPPTAIDPRALATLGIDLDAVRARLEERFGEGALEQTRRGCRPVEPSLKRALAHALQSASGQPPDDRAVLGGLVSVEDSAAVRVLRQLGIDAGDVASRT
jgi:ATP-dependent Clp protease ATP-binding subunit ClpA